MKKFTRTGKKALSVFLAVLVVMTAWVFTPIGFKASAISAGNYYVKIAYTIINSENKVDKNYTGSSSFTQGSNKNHQAGFSLYYKTNNGTGTEYEVYWDIGRDKVCGQASGSGATVNTPTGNITSTGSYTATATIPGFPTKIYAVLDNDAISTCEYAIKSISVGSSSSNLTTIWGSDGSTNSGIYLNSSWNGKYVTLNSDYTWSSNDSSNANVSGVSTKNWNYPKASTITWTTSSTRDVTTPVDSSTITRYVRSYCKDQYGVTLACNPTYSFTCTGDTTSKTGITAATDNTTSTSYSEYKFTISKSALLSTKGQNTRKVNITAKYTFGGATKTDSTTKYFNVTDPKYTITFNGNGGTVSPTSYAVYYGESLNSQSTYDGDVSTYPKSGTRTGYTWIGMFDGTGTGAALMNPDAVLNAAKTYYAHWDINKYVAVFWDRLKQNVVHVESDISYGADITDAGTLAASKLPDEYDEAYHYTFSNWDTTLTSITANKPSIWPVYNKEAHTFDSGTAVAATCLHGAGTEYKCTACDYSYVVETSTTKADHQFGDAVTVTKEPTCTVAGEGYKTCTICGVHSNTVTVPATGHSYKVEKTDATCTKAGSIKYTCTKCNYTYTETLPKIAHNMQAQTKVAATCTSAAYTPYKCANCTYSYNAYDASQPAIGHSWGAWSVTTAATNTTDGVMSRTCSKCNTTETATIPKGGHAFSTTPTIETAATCHSTGAQIFKCTAHTNCGVQITVTTAKTAHNFSTTITQANCTTKGSVVTKCQNSGCTETITTEIPATGHNYQSSTVTTEATCTAAGVRTYTCSKCSATKTETIPATGHKFVTVPATCIADGSKKCALCGYSETISKTGHSVGDWEVLKAATCKDNGVRVKKCSTCGQIQTVELIDKLTTHSWSAWSTLNAATCTNKGVEIRTCSVCGKNETRETSALGHSYAADFTTDIAATCTTAGVKSIHCSRCEVKKDITVIEALGHTWNSGVENPKATCTADGVKTYTCSVCGGTKTETIPALGHNFVAGTPVAATCKSSGYIPYTCSRNCGAGYNVINGDSSTAHNWNITTNTADGKTTVSGVCTVCGATFSKTVSSAHNFNEIKTNTPATCKNKGSLVLNCTDAGCNETLSVELPVNANAHSGVTNTVTAATCETKGSVVSKCSDCGKTLATTEIPATGHSYTIQTEYVPSTCMTKGHITFRCANCTSTKTVELAVNSDAHKFISKTNGHHDATCATPAYDEYVCEYGCGETYNKYSGGEVLAHDWEFTTSKTGTTLTVTCKCKNCTESHTQTIDVAEGHNYTNVTVTTQPTCTAAGTVTIACDKVHDADCTSTVTATLPANPSAHDKLKTIVTSATCETEGTASTICESCGKTVGEAATIAALGHNYVGGEETVKTAATCEADGTKTVKCTRCDNTMETVIPKTGHSWDGGTKHEATCTTGEYTTYKCLTCNTTKDVVPDGAKANGHNWGEWVITNPTNDAAGSATRTCNNCDETETVAIPAGNHKFDATKYTEVAATCTAKGSRTYTCTEHTGENACGVSITVETDLAQHNCKIETVQPTCTDEGLVVAKCSVCNEVFGTYDIAALGHDFSEVTETVASTCNSVGHVTKKCSRCDATETTYSSALAAHTWGGWETKQEQSDVLPKIEVRQCSVCGVYDYRYTAPSGAHDWDEGQVTTAATCTTEGVKTYTCKRTHCDCTAENPLTYTEVIPATGHSAKVENKEATCTEDGYVKAVCETCHAELDSKVLPMKGHTEKVTVTEPTCTTPGSKVYTCAVCGAPTKSAEEIPVVPHAYEATGEYTEATCTTPKYETYKCKYCDKTQLVKVAEANGHDATENYVVKEAATCTKAGYSEWRCHCGVLLGTKVLQPTTHSYTETVNVAFDNACEGAGYSYKKCSVCGAIDPTSFTNNDIGHTYTYTTEREATCTAEGLVVAKCSVCDDVRVEIAIPAVGHTYNDGEITTEQTCEADGIVTFTCTREGCTDAQAGHTITKNIGKKNHNYVASGSPTAATCTSSGYQLYKCEYCNKEFREILEAPANHIYEKQSTSVEPNCYQGGHYVYKCKNCVASYEYDLPATGNHDIKSEVIQPQSCTEVEITRYTCNTEGCPYNKEEITKSVSGHVWGDWTVTKEPNEETGENGEQVRQCTREGCTATETAPIPASIHNWGADPITTTDVSCTAAATETYQCTGCDLCNDTTGYKTYVKTIGVPSQHNVIVEYNKPTCTSAGSYVAKCSLCGTEFKNETLAATGHSFNTYLQSSYVPATCQEEGSVTYACSNADCGETQTTVLDVNPNAHNMVEDIANSKTATCTTAGYKAYKCANQGCDHMYMMQIENPTAHTAKDSRTVVKAATCCSDGYQVLECRDCNAILSTETIPATGSHTWETVRSANENPTCTESSYSYSKCSACGKLDESSFTVKNATGHDFSVFVSKKDATPTENGYVIYKCSHDGCSEELKSVIPASGHSFTSAVTKEPTCTEKGEKTYTCTIHTDCESNYTEEIPALGHIAGDVELTAATCLSEGSATVKCTRESCSAVLHSKKIEKLPHTFNDTKREVVEPTCQTTGSVTYTCTTAGCTAKLVTTLDKIPHDYKLKESKQPTCTDSGYDVYACATAGCTASYNVVTTSATGHRFTEDTTRYVAPGCATAGHKYFKCSVCNAEGYDYEVPATGNHSYNVTETVPATCETAGYTYNKCACGAVESSSVRALDPLGHNYIVDMGNGVMKCERCDKTITAEKTLTEDGVTHTFIGRITKQSTCQEHGIISYTCQNHTDCTKNHTEELPLASHSATAASIVKVDPQCMADGTLINGSITVSCSVCGTQIGETISVPAAHKYTVVKVERATCGSKGRVTERCSVCGNERVTELEMNTSAHEFESIPAVSVAATCTTDGYAVYNCKHCDAQRFVKTAEKLEHKHTESVSKDATCEAEGYVRIICKDCGKLLSEETIGKVAHTKEVITVEPTCTNGGTVTTKCSVCGKLLEDIAYIPAKGHTWGDWVVISGGTCAVEGKRTRECTVCHETETISTGVGEHVYPAEGVVTPPTCETDGFTTYTCTVCNNHSIIKDYVPKLGHKYSNDYKIVVEPTCHSTGSKAHYCLSCGSFEQDQSKYVELPKLAHAYGEWVVVTEPTCDTNGVRVRTCTGCSDKDEGHTQTEAIGKIGHNYGEWEVTKKATCVEEGSQRRYCDRCKTWEVKAIPKGGHNRVADNAVEATCTSVGKTAGSHCSICGYVFVAQQEIPMKEHMDLNGDGKCEGCEMTMHFDDGTDTCLCHGTGFRAFIYKIVLIFWKLFKINKTCVCGAKHY